MYQNYYARMFRGSLEDEKLTEFISSAPVTDRTIRPATLYLAIYIDGYVLTLLDSASDIPIFHGCFDMTNPNEGITESFREAGVLKHAPNPGMFGLESERAINADLLQMICIAISAACIADFQRYMSDSEFGDQAGAPPIIGKYSVPMLEELLDLSVFDGGVPDPHEMDVFNLIDDADINLN